MDNNLVYLDTYVLQQDMRIRLPKLVLANLDADKGSTMFDIFLNTENQTIVLKKSDGTNIRQQEDRGSDEN